MRWPIALITSSVLLAGGIAISQQPPVAGTPPGTRTGTPSGADVQPQALPNASAGTGAIAVPAPPANSFVARLPASDADPEVAELNRLDQQLEHESRALVHQLAQPEQDKKLLDDLKQKLREALEKQFDAQQKLRELEVTRIEERVRKLRELITKRNGARQTIVDRRQQQLIDDAEGFGWSAGAASVDPFQPPPAVFRYSPQQVGPRGGWLSLPGTPGAPPLGK